MDQVRREEQKSCPELKRSRYIWLKNPSNLTTGILEGINSLVQAAKARARGYRTTRNLITMIYLIAGKLQYDLPA